MEIDATVIDDAIDFLIQGNETDAARTLQSCSFIGSEYNDSWMDGNRRLDGIDIELAANRAVYETLSNQSDPITKSIGDAFSAVLPPDTYLKSIRVRAISRRLADDRRNQSILSEATKKRLIENVEAQKALMIAISTGGPRIDTVNKQYQERQIQIRQDLSSISISNPNPFNDLWTWYGKWSDGSLLTYQSRRKYITDMYSPLIEALYASRTTPVQPIEPTGWARVDRNGKDNIWT